jgi:hypothetical protein
MPESDLFAGPPPDSETALLRQLDELVAAGRIALAIDRRKLTHIDFPLGLDSDGNLWAYPLVLASALAWWFGGIWIGLGAAVAAAAIYQIFGRAFMARRLERRIRERGLKNTETWRKLWRFGGVVLTPADGPPCQGPDGNWMALVRATEQHPPA